ncbi:hypothetical protein IG631_20219 [Alternaria alternata]|nr:hypothetical protein IG631_20219 [Alternaria alternata]
MTLAMSRNTARVSLPGQLSCKQRSGGHSYKSAYILQKRELRLGMRAAQWARCDAKPS